jgi:hypothetical protein
MLAIVAGSLWTDNETVTTVYDWHVPLARFAGDMVGLEKASFSAEDR